MLMTVVLSGMTVTETMLMTEVDDSDNDSSSVWDGSDNDSSGVWDGSDNDSSGVRDDSDNDSSGVRDDSDSDISWLLSQIVTNSSSTNSTTVECSCL